MTYIAGFFDGEGSIFVSKSKKQYFLTVSISNTNLLVLDSIQRIIGGSISKSPDSHDNSFQLFRLRLCCNEAKKFLERIKIKREQAKLAIKFQSKIEVGKPTIPKEEQEKHRIQINSFNKKACRRVVKVSSRGTSQNIPEGFDRDYVAASLALGLGQPEITLAEMRPLPPSMNQEAPYKSWEQFTC